MTANQAFALAFPLLIAAMCAVMAVLLVKPWRRKTAVHEDQATLEGGVQESETAVKQVLQELEANAIALRQAVAERNKRATELHNH